MIAYALDAFGFPVELRLANAAAQRLRGFL